MRFHGMLPLVTEADGILTTTTTRRLGDWLAERKDRPIVTLLQSFEPMPYPAVEVDYQAAARAGARHMLELGHVHYAFYLAYPEDTIGRDAFREELARNGRAVTILDFSAARPGQNMRAISRHERECWLAAELKRLPMPVAIMTVDDRRSIEVEGACAIAGLRIPEDVAILGCDNQPIEQALSRIPLSSVDMNFRGVGRKAAEILDLLMDGGAPPDQTIFVPPSGVVPRRSTATFVVDSPGISAAVLHIREHFHERLRVPDLARIAGHSLSVFHAEFKRWMGRSVHEELQRVRLGHVARLLRDTDWKLDTVAAECGFSSGRYMATAFFEVHGVRPQAWREAARQELEAES